MSCKALQEKNLKTQIAFRNDLVFNNDVFNIFLFKFMHYILFFLVEKVWDVTVEFLLQYNNKGNQLECKLCVHV